MVDDGNDMAKILGLGLAVGKECLMVIDKYSSILLLGHTYPKPLSSHRLAVLQDVYSCTRNIFLGSHQELYNHKSVKLLRCSQSHICVGSTFVTVGCWGMLGPPSLLCWWLDIMCGRKRAGQEFDFQEIREAELLQLIMLCHYISHQPFSSLISQSILVISHW